VKIGEIEILPVIDGTVSLPPRRVYGMKDVIEGQRGYDIADWEPHKYLLDGDGKVELTQGGYLVLTGDRVVLIDAGIADLGFGPFRGGQMLESLQALGYAPSDVTDVILTHLHADHIEPGPGQPPRERLDVFESRLETFDGDTTLMPGVDTLAAYGHTPGSTVVVLSSGTSRAMVLGDAVHCAVELLDDDWTRISDIDPELALRTRIALARELEGADIVVAGAHFPGLQMGRVLPGEGVRRWVMA
jgi:glyoxylase-like metal-dependent hydrolase (beta-lactamase superfamily II)